MKNKPAILFVFVLTFISTVSFAQTEIQLDSFISATDSFIEKISLQTKVLKMRNGTFSTKTHMRCKYNDGVYLVSQKIKFKHGVEMEQTSIRYEASYFTVQVLDFTRINNEYTYIKRTKYKKDNWEQKVSVEELVGLAYKKTFYDSESKKIHFWLPKG